MNTVGAATDAGQNLSAKFLEWGVVQISLANLLVIIVMVVLLVLALVLPFPHGDRSTTDRSDEK